MANKPSISIIGAGRVGQALALGLQSHGYVIRAVVCKTASHAKRAAKLINHATLALSAAQLEQLPPSDLLLITTPDDVIQSIARQLAKLKRGRRQRDVVLHTSGALSSTVLAPLAKTGFHTGSIHPLISVSNPQNGAASLHGAFYCLEGDAIALRTARSLVRDLGGSAFSIKAKDKPLYHAAAVMASPHLVSLFDLSSQMLEACGLTRKRAREILLPLVASTLRNLQSRDPVDALTGTFARGDVATVKRHMKAISSKRIAGALLVYKLLGEHSLEIAKSNHLDSKIVEQIRKVLGSKKN